MVTARMLSRKKEVVAGVGQVFVILVLFFANRSRGITFNMPRGEGRSDAATLASRIELPPGFSMGDYAAEIPKARRMLFSR